MKPFTPALIPNLLKQLWHTIRASFAQTWQTVRPGPHAIRGASRAMLIAAILIYLVFILDVSQAPLGPRLIFIAIFIPAGLLLLWLGQGIAWASSLPARIPWPLRWSLAAGVALLLLSFMSLGPNGALLTVAVLLASAAVIGAGAAVLLGKNLRRPTPVHRAVAIAGLAGGLLLAGAGLAWYLWPGSPATAVINAAQLSDPVSSIELPDPSQPGPYSVQTLTYGSGTDSLRSEFGKQVDITTQTVDGTRLLKGSWEGLPGQLRSQLWGFGSAQLPVNGRAWYPSGTGGDSTDPYPLVLMVHGNHSMTDFSDPGYAYLGELMASRGFIFVSVDENFLNGGLPDMFSGFSGENDARAWMLLEHLRVWESWNDDSASLFYKKVDLNNIALIGHSRGGEAAAVAALFNLLPYYPDDAAQVFDYGYHIRAIAAIAPSDGQYQPSAKPVELTDIQYFVLHGSHDGDVSTFSGINQYERIHFTPGFEGFKSALYIYRANHGQFNSTWGDNDRGALLAGGFFNRQALLAKTDQEQIAKVYLSAFLEASLHQQDGYLPLLADARTASAWLPDTIYINRFERSGDQMAADFEEDVDLTTARWAGSRIQGENLELWREQKIPTKGGNQFNSAVILGWNQDDPASYTITLPTDLPPLTSRSALLFSLADAMADPTPADSQTAEPPNSPRQPVDLSIELLDSDGNSAVLPLGQYLRVQPQLEVRIFKAGFLERKKRSEPVLQSYAIDLQDFSDANPAINLTRLHAIRFLFNLTPHGSVVLDEVGFRP